MVSAEAGIDRVLWTEAEVAAELAADLRPLREPPVVVGVATGALLFLADLVCRVDAPLAVDFVRVESYGAGTESSGAPRITSDLKIDVAGKHVFVFVASLLALFNATIPKLISIQYFRRGLCEEVKDIVDTGNTLSCLITHLEKKGASSISVCTFLDKPARRKVNIQLVGDGKFYHGFECLDYFVVGYGLDYAELSSGVLSSVATTMSSFLSTTSSASLLPFRCHHAAIPSLSFPLKPRRFLPFSRIPPNPPRCCRIPTNSCCKPHTSGVLSFVATASRTLLFLLAASLLSLSGIREPPALASTPLPTQQPQKIEEQDEQQESEESKEQGEDDVKKLEEEVKEKEEKVEADDEVKMYLAILSRNPGDLDALKCILFAKMRRADWDGALRYTRQLREAEPGEVEWRLMEAQLHELRGDLTEAERQFREVLAEDPLLIPALHGLALCMRKRLEGPSAFEMLENALQLAVSEKRVPDERNIKLLIAQMHVVMGELDVASEKLQNLINEDPRDFRPHLCQGIAYALLDKKEEADVQFDIYRSLVPDEFPDKSFINDIIQAAKVESNDQVRKEFGYEFLWEK